MSKKQKKGEFSFLMLEMAICAPSCAEARVMVPFCYPGGGKEKLPAVCITKVY